MQVTARNGSVEFDEINPGARINITAGDISVAKPFAVTGNVLLDALTGTVNVDSVTTTGGYIDINAIQALSVTGTLTAAPAGLQATFPAGRYDIELSSINDNVNTGNVVSAGVISVTAGNDVVVNNLNAASKLNITATGNVTLTGAVTAAGDVKILADKDITIINATGAKLTVEGAANTLLATTTQDSGVATGRLILDEGSIEWHSGTMFFTLKTTVLQRLGLIRTLKPARVHSDRLLPI